MKATQTTQPTGTAPAAGGSAPSFRLPPRWLCAAFRVAGLSAPIGRRDPGLWLMQSFNRDLDVQRGHPDATYAVGRFGIAGASNTPLGRFVAFYPRKT